MQSLSSTGKLTLGGQHILAIQMALFATPRRESSQAQGKHQQAVVMFRKDLDTFTELGGGWLGSRVCLPRW
jgi:hypothetical protein